MEYCTEMKMSKLQLYMWQHEAYKYYAEQKNPGTKKYALFDLIYLKTKNRKSNL